MKKIILTALLLGGISQLMAQTAEDALRYSRVFYSGTARFNGLGGAFGAVGADFSTLATNPAGIGLYQASEMTFTIAPIISNSSSLFEGNNTTADRVNFGLGNFGFIFNIKPTNQGRPGLLKSLNFGFGFNRQNDFNNEIAINGYNRSSSMMQSWVNELNASGTRPEFVYDDYPFDLGLAYNANLIAYDSVPGEYYCDAQYGGVLQSKTINSYGSMNEIDLSLGGNIADQLYFGLTLGIPTLRYYERSVYQEAAASDTIPNFISLNYYYNLQTQGTGINVKFGLIYRPVNWFRIGATIHTPTWFPSMNDEWFSSMTSRFTVQDWNTTAYSPIGNFNYRLTTPFRAMGSVAFIIGAYGLVSADYEYVNYSQARFNSTQDSFSDINNDISTGYQSWGNLRLGTEWRLGDFRLRGGFAYFSNPYKQGTNNTERYQASGGFGYRSKYFFADVTYVWSQMKQEYYLYDRTMVPAASITNNTHTVYTTIGFRF